MDAPLATATTSGESQYVTARSGIPKERIAMMTIQRIIRFSNLV